MLFWYQKWQTLILLKAFRIIYPMRFTNDVNYNILISHSLFHCSQLWSWDWWSRYCLTGGALNVYCFCWAEWVWYPYSVICAYIYFNVKPLFVFDGRENEARVITFQILPRLRTWADSNKDNLIKYWKVWVFSILAGGTRGKRRGSQCWKNLLGVQKAYFNTGQYNSANAR